MSSGVRGHNQRLEFVGDRVLNLVIAEALFQDDPTASEGTLAPRYNALVRKETCAEIARAIDLGAVLKLGRSETMSGGRPQQALLASCFTVVEAAIEARITQYGMAAIIKPDPKSPSAFIPFGLVNAAIKV